MSSPHHFSGTLLFLLVITVVSLRGVLAVNILAANLQLPPNSYLRAGDFYLAMLEDCELVLFNESQPIYRSGITGSNCSGLAMQADANLVVYDGPTTVDYAIWASGSTVRGPRSRKFSYYLALDTIGNLNIFDADGMDNAPLPWTQNLTKVGVDFQPPAGGIATMIDWKPPSLDSVHSFMYVGYYLSKGAMSASVNGRFTVTLQNDCNVQVQDTRQGLESVVWETTNVSSRSPCKLTLERTGKLIIVVETSMEVLSESSVEGQAGVQWALTVDDSDGHLEVLDLLNRETVLWTTEIPVGLIPASTPSPSPNDGASPPSSTASPGGSMSSSSVTHSFAFRATVGACIGGILILGAAVCALACQYRRKRCAIDQAENGLQMQADNELEKADEANSSAWSKSTFSAHDTQTSVQSL